jgi:single-stranded DNA-binding protein
VIDALIHGRIFGKPQSRTSKAGKQFVTAKLSVPMQDGQSVFANLITFRQPVGTALLALDDGAAVAVSGEIKVSTYVAKDGSTKPSIDIVAHEILSAYHITKRRKAVAKDDQAPAGTAAHAAPADFDDPIPF